MLALGIDPGTRHLGWGLVRRDGNRTVHVAHGVIDLPPTAPLAVRLCELAVQLRAVVAGHRPDVAAVETLFFHKDPQAAAKLGHARGVVLLTLSQQGVLIAEYAPARVKRTIAGNGQATKQQVAMMVKSLLTVADPLRADASDALALALTHLRAAPALAQRAASGQPALGRRRGTRQGRAVLRALLRERGLAE